MIQLLKNMLYSVLLIFTAISAFSAEPVPFSRQISVREGLPARIVYDLISGHDGYIYLATDKGLVRYDGVRFHVFPSKDHLALSVIKLRQDHKGSIWGMNVANQVLQLVGDTLRPYHELSAYLDDETGNLTNMLFHGDSLWMITERALFLTHNDQNLQRVALPVDFHQSVLTSLAYDARQGLLYLGTTTNIYSMDGKGRMQAYKAAEGQKEMLIYENRLIYLVKGITNQLWDLAGIRFDQSIVPDGTFFIHLRKTGEGLWLCTGNGLFKINTRLNMLEKGLFEGLKINSVISDIENNQWVGTLESGIFYLPGIRQLVTGDDVFCTPKHFTCIARDDEGNIFAGTSNGELYHFNAEEKLEMIYHTQAGNEIEYVYLSGDRIITSQGYFRRGDPTPRIRLYFGKGLSPDHLGNFFIANYNHAGFMPKRLNGKPNVPAGFPDADLIPYGNYNLWVYPLRNTRAHAVFFCHQKNVWYVGYSDYLMRYDQNGVGSRIDMPDGEPIIALSIICDANGILWVGTSRQGMIKIDSGRVQQQYHTGHGLSGNHCRKLYFDDKGIWILTDKGPDFYDLASKKILNTSIAMGIKDVNVNEIVASDQQIWMATDQGLLSVFRHQLRHDIVPVFSFVPKADNEIMTAGMKPLSFRNNSVVFHFDALFYRSLGDYVFEYRLLGSDTLWSRQSARVTSVNYLSLKHGKYTFQARVRADNLISPLKEFSFVVLKPFYLQPWFIVLQVFILTVFIYKAYRLSERITLKRQELREQMALSQLTALRSQMNPHFVFNILTAVQGLIYSNQKNKANQYLGTFSDLMRKTLDASDKTETTIAQEMETIRLYVLLEKERFEENEFHYAISIPQNVDVSAFTMPSLVLQPFVENAIKHGLMHKKGYKQLTITVERKSEIYWEFRITDNGIGRDASVAINQKTSKHKSFATVAIENRITLMNKMNLHPIRLTMDDLFDDHQKACGTRITLQIPVKHT